MTDQPAPRPVSWNDGSAYESYIGRWSRTLAPEFIRWLNISPNAAWLDVGCGTGALSEAILRDAAPASILGVDLSSAHIDYARAHVVDARVRFEVADALSLPVEDASADVVVSGLVINFVPDPDQAMAEMARAVKPGGTVAVYVWDYVGGMQMMDIFWDAAAALGFNPTGAETGRKYPITKPDLLTGLFGRASLEQMESRGIETTMRFDNFDDYWSPFLPGQGSAPKYLMSLTEPQREQLREAVRVRLPAGADGSIALAARVWAVRGRRP